MNKIMNTIDNCPCGRHHECSIKAVISEKNPINIIRSLIDEYKKPLAVCDNVIYEICGRKIADEIGVDIKVLYSDGVLIPDKNNTIKVENELQKGGYDYIIAIGSGVINDICKYVSFIKEINYMVIATAPSMDGYASTAAAMLFDGLKTTFTTHVPEYIVADVDVMKDAPMKMIQSGIGDVLGKVSSLNDWKLAHIVTGEAICENIFDKVKKEVEICISNIPMIIKREESAIKLLFESLVNVGICMSYMGNSRPASGAEHHMAHFFEVTGIINGTNYLSHGLDVAVSTYVTCCLRKMLSESDFSSFHYSYNREENAAELEKVFSVIAPELIEMRDEKDLYSNRLNDIQANERLIKSVLKECPTPDEYLRIAESADIDILSLIKTYKVEDIQNCIIYAKDLKDRYTLFRILNNAGKLESFSDIFIENL